MAVMGKPARAFTTLGGFVSELEQSSVRRRLMRLQIFLLLVFDFFALSSLRRSPVMSAISNTARRAIFPNWQRNIDALIRQQLILPIGKMTSGNRAAALLNAMQTNCYLTAFGLNYPDEMTSNYACEVDSVFAHDTLPNPRWDYICQADVIRACTDGDHAALDMIPKILEMVYTERNIPPHQWIQTKYTIGSHFPFFAPLLMPGANDALSPIGKLTEKLNILLSAVKNRVVSPWEAHGRWGVPLPSKRVRLKVDGERNHHWDILFRCSPASLKVRFRVSDTQPAGGVRHTAFVELQFDRLGSYLNMYKSNLVLRPESHGGTATEHALCLAHLITLLFGPTLYASIFAFCNTPSVLYDIHCGVPNIKLQIDRLIDPSMVRLKAGVPRWAVICENLASMMLVHLLIVVVVNLALSVSTQAIVQFSAGDILEFVYDTYRKHSKIHGFVMLIYGIRLCEVMTGWFGSPYVILTFIVGFIPVIHFFVMFMGVLTSFALVSWSAVGHIFPQYASLGSSIYATLLFVMSFSQAAAVEELVYPSIESDAVKLCFIHVCVMIVGVIAMLNTFTTLVMSCYANAVRICEDPKGVEKFKSALWYSLKIQLHYFDEIDEDIRILGGRPENVIWRTVPYLEDGILEIKVTENVPVNIGKELVDPMVEALELLDSIQPVLNTLMLRYAIITEKEYQRNTEVANKQQRKQKELFERRRQEATLRSLLSESVITVKV